LMVAAVVVTFAIRTWLRNPIWRDNKTVILGSLADEPLDYRAHERVADALARAGDTTASLREYGRARFLYPGDPYLYLTPAEMVARRGGANDPSVVALLDSARGIDPSPYADAMRRAWVHYAARDYQGTIVLTRAAYAVYRDSVDAIMVLTQAAEQLHDVSAATAALHLALADHPRDQGLHRSYAALLQAVGDTVLARKELEAAEN
jgi:hypothetical protein